VDFQGILTHAGHSYRARTRDEAAQVASHERDVMVRFAHRLRDANMRFRDISIGSTPTITAVDDLRGVTEVRPGNYLFFDAFQVEIGSCGLDDVALSVLATVIGVYPERKQLVIDSGALALSKDPGPTHVNPDCGYGIAASVNDQKPLPGLTVASLSQEHAVVQSDRSLGPSWRPGSRVRILPNHSCLAAACFDRYHVVRGTEIVDEWKTVRGW
jgi:D-serine deaminase-like pyridoxal phosphate-dependent protein